MNLHVPTYRDLLEFRMFDSYRMPGKLEEERFLPLLDAGGTFTTRELAEKVRIRPEEVFKVLCWYWTQRRVIYNVDETGKPVSWTVVR